MAHSCTEWDKPKIITLYWPIGIGGAAALNHEGAELHCNQLGDGCYSLRIDAYNWVEITLKDGGQTESIKREEKDYPPPKTRLKTRYRNGQWERYSIVKGWIK